MPWLVGLSVLLLLLIGGRTFLMWRAKAARYAEMRQQEIDRESKYGTFTRDEAAALYDAVGDKVWNRDRYSDAELDTILKIGTNLRGTVYQSRDRRTSVHSALRFFTR